MQRQNCSQFARFIARFFTWRCDCMAAFSTPNLWYQFQTITVAIATQIKNTMKKSIVMAAAILLTAGIAVFAADAKPAGSPKKQFDYQIAFSKIVISDDINVILKEDNERIIYINGIDEAIEKVDWKIKDGTLYLKSKHGSLKNKATVSINVKQLEEVYIKGKSTVTSAGYLLSPNLHIFLENDCNIAIKNTGQIYVLNAYGVELDVKSVVGDVRVGR